jgi:hypothetical protein
VGTAQIGFRHSSKPVQVFAVLRQSDRNEEAVIPTTRRRVLWAPISEFTPFQYAFRAVVRAKQKPKPRMRNRITIDPITTPMSVKSAIAGSIYNDILQKQTMELISISVSCYEIMTIDRQKSPYRMKDTKLFYGIYNLFRF